MGRNVGLTAPIPPTPRDYYALKACRNRRRKTCGRLWAAENPRLGPGVDVAGPRPAATSRRARGLAGFLAERGHVVRRRRAAGPQPGARANRLPPSDFKNFAKRARPTEAGSQLLARQDKKLTELLDLLSASKPNQLRGLLSE